MRTRRLLAAALLAGLGLNTWSGVVKIVSFHHRHAAELALADAELDEAYRHLTQASRWQPDDSPTYVLISNVIHHAQANGIPLEPLEGHDAIGTFGVGLAAITRAVALNPADAWAWFNIVD